MKKTIISLLALAVAVLAFSKNEPSTPSGKCFIGKTDRATLIVQFFDSSRVSIAKIRPNDVEEKVFTYEDYDGFISIDTDTYCRFVELDGNKALEFVQNNRQIVLSDISIKK